MFRVVLDHPEGRDPHLVAALELCDRHWNLLALELKDIDEKLLKETQEIEEVRRLMTIPAVGRLVAAVIYAWVGDVTRFRNARALAAYSGLVTSVWQSGDSQRSGHITKQGSPALRRMLVQAAQVLMSRCHSPEAEPLQAIAARVYQSRHRKKIAVVAMARHILRLAYYILRDGTVYDPKLLCRVMQDGKTEEKVEQDSRLTMRLHRSPEPGKREGARPRNSLACIGQAVR
jgi:transposase